jgi:hypothetical protein
MGKFLKRITIMSNFIKLTRYEYNKIFYINIEHIRVITTDEDGTTIILFIGDFKDHILVNESIDNIMKNIKKKKIKKDIVNFLKVSIDINKYRSSVQSYINKKYIQQIEKNNNQTKIIFKRTFDLDVADLYIINESFEKIFNL